MMNTWASIYESWVGPFNIENLPVYSFYDYVSYYEYTPSTGDYGTNNDFSFSWTDNFDSWVQNRWTKENHTFWGNRCQFNPSNAVFQDGYLILCLTNLNELGYNGDSPSDNIYGCMDTDAINYNPNANQDSGLCQYLAYFSVDISDIDVSGTDNNGESFYGVYLQGSFNDWCGLCNQMTDSNNDNIYETAVILSSGEYEYQYTINGWNWHVGPAPLESSCDYNPIDEWGNYGFEISDEPIYLNTYYFGSCDESDSSNCNVIGDANQDNELNILDIIVLIDYIIESNQVGIECVDINQDNELNILDIVQMIELIID